MVIAGSFAAAPVAAQNFRIITREAQVEAEELVELTDESLTVRTERGSFQTIAIDDCVVLLNLSAASRPRSSAYAPLGMVVLADGQRLPGSPMLGPESDANVLQWRHRQFGHIGVPLDRIAWAGFRAGAQPPEPGEADTVLLTNGDRIDGFVTAIGDPLEIEQDGRQTLIEFERIASVRLVTPPTTPAAGARRIWFHDGTVADVPSLMLDGGDIYFNPAMRDSAEGDLDSQPSDILGILFNIDSMVPLASLPVLDVEGPLTRYATPAPEIDGAEAGLGLGSVTLRGPLVVRYALPPAASRLVGEVRLAGSAPEWSDCELVISALGRELWRQLLDGEHPRMRFDVPLESGELAIEVTEGARGSVGDHVVLEGAMIIVDPLRE